MSFLVLLTRDTANMSSRNSELKLEFALLAYMSSCSKRCLVQFTSIYFDNNLLPKINQAKL